MTQLGGLIGRGVSWSALSAMLLRFGQLAIGIVVARIMLPQEFGIFAVAMVVYAIVVNVSDVGLGSAIIREVGRTREIAPTVTSIALVAGIVLAGLMAMAAPVLAETFGAVEATPVIRLLAATVAIGSVGAVPAAVLARDYRQKQRFAADATSFAVSSIVLILLALLGWGVMALAWSRVAGQIASSVLLLIMTPERYWPGFNRQEAGKLLRFSLPLAGSSLIGFTIGSVDSMVVGKVRGATQLAYYNQAYNISSWPVSVFTAILNGVTLATLSRVKESVAELRMHLSVALSALAAASFLVSALCAALSVPLVTLLYGAPWAPAAAPLAVLAVFGSVRVVIGLFSDLLVALGCTRRLLGLQVLWLAVLVPSMIVCVGKWGVVGAAAAHVGVALLIILPVNVAAVSRGTGLGTRWIGQAVAVPLAGSILAFGAAWFVSSRFEQPLIGCAAGALAGLAAYAVVVAAWLRRLVLELRRLYGRSTSVPSVSALVAAEPVSGVRAAAPDRCQ